VSFGSTLLPRFHWRVLWLLAFTAFAAEKPQLVLPSGYNLAVGDMAFSPDGKLFAFMNRGGGAIRLWDLSAERELRTLNIGPRLPIPGGRFVFTPTGDRIVAESDGFVKVWEVGLAKNYTTSYFPNNDLRT